MKTMIVSGGASGIGFACAKKFLANGYFVYNLDLIDNPNSQIFGKTYQWIKVDVCQKEAIRDAVTNIIHDRKQIDALIVSAGKHLSENIENTSDQNVHELIQLNVMGAFWLIQAVIPFMKINLSGNIVTIGSDQCIIAKRNSCVYGMTKAALASLTKSIALDYATYNIRANCIGAGTINTPLYQNAIQNYAKKSGISLAEIEKMEALEQPIGRIGNPEEVAELVYFLSQNHAAYITGTVISMDGGYTTK